MPTAYHCYIMKNVSGTYRNGMVELDESVDWPDETSVQVSAGAGEEEVCVDGTPWPKTEEEIEARCREIEEMPPLFEDPNELVRFETYLAESKAEQKELERQSWEKTEKLFE
ncbi:MAG: hypothetical protein QGF00_05575 [Planctomycetota bacterium]|nr:hypothetical protein [Planctomycetota bacterium]MDP7249051.1 hypothetical protein [Planctomycetota bacterium]